MQQTSFKLAFVILFLAISTSFSFAQSVRISGSITGQADGTAIDYASVALIHLPDSVQSGLSMTNDKGFYSFEQVKAGAYLIKVIAIGYDRFSGKAFDVAATPVVLPEIRLQANVKQLNEVSILARAPKILQLADRTVVNVAQMNTTGDNALEVLQRSPNIRLDKDENIVFKGKTGINVMIDGKMTYMSGSELTTYLKSLPASVISKIELISNPPSSFDAAGSAGIIDIKLKRNQLEGFNGNVSAGAGYGKYEKVYGSMNINYNTGKISSYARMSYGHYNSFNLLTLRRNIAGEQFNQVNLWHPITESFNYALGADYNMSERHTFGVIWKGYSAPYTTNSESNSLNYNAAGEKMGSVTSQNPQDVGSGNYALNLNYRLKIDTLGRTLGFDADHVGYKNDKTEQFFNRYLDASESQIGDLVSLRNKGNGTVSIYALKVDYVHPFSTTLKAEMGYKSSWVGTNSDVRFDALKNEEWINDPKRTNNFSYNENINAAYISFSQSFKTLDLKGGLRAEQTLGNGFSSDTDEKIDRKYWQLFPSLFAGWKISSNHQLQASYSRRISRPSYSSLNPFAFYSDPYTAIKGNPVLLPSLSNNFELNYSYKNFRLLSLSYTRQSDIFSTVIYQNDQTKESISIEENIGKSNSLYASTGTLFDITKWWNNNNELSISYEQIRTAVQGSAYNKNQFSWSASTENTFSLPKEIQLTLGAYYQAPSVSGLFKSLESYGINVGAKKTLMNKKATISLKMNDIFDTNKARAYLQYNNVNTYWQNQWESRKVNLSFSYKFGNMKIKTARSRKTGTGDEEDRVKN